PPTEIPYPSKNQDFDIGSKFYMRRGFRAGITTRWQITDTQINEEPDVKWFYSKSASGPSIEITFSLFPSISGGNVVFESTNFPDVSRAILGSMQTLFIDDVQDDKTGFY
ncbi:hypothetical protein, partial [Salmonella sp. s51228]|uniref:hypothetical protein n=1 Tax=Salmonella sp. s51228 TaxID=3159652 RepID=UPI00397F9FD5